MSRYDPQLGRRMALLRLWSVVVGMLPAVGLLPHTPSFAGLLLAAVTLVQGLLSWGSYTLFHTVQDGEEGELLYVAGGRVSLAFLARQRRLEVLSLALASIGVVALLALATPWTLLHAVLCCALAVPVGLAFRVQWRGTRLLSLLRENRQEEALTLSERWSRQRHGHLLTQAHVTALLMCRRVDEARKLRASSWNGSVDRHAAGIALDQLQQGDPKVATALLENLEGDDRYARYLRALLTGHQALFDAPGSFRVDPTLLADLPEMMGTELVLLDAAHARSRGDAMQLRHVDLDVESWRGAAYPELWRCLGGAPSAAVAPEAPITDHVFSAPSEQAEAPRRRWSAVGALPLPGAPVTTPWRPFIQALLALLSALLFVLSLLLFAIAAAVDVVGEPVITGQWEISTLGIAVSVFLGIRYVLLRLAARAEQGIRLEDDRTFDATRPWRLNLAIAVPFVSSLVIPPVALLALAVQVDAVVLVAAVVVVWVALLLVQLVRRFQIVRLVRLVHTGSDDAMAKAAQRAPQLGRAWRILAHYVRADREAARAAAENPVLVVDEVRDLVRWDAAALGDIDLDTLLGQRPVPEAGARFRHEVAVRLAALRERRAHEVQERIDPELYLPNRIGDGLRVLDHAVLSVVDPAQARRITTTYAPELRQGAWIRRCWPELFQGASEP